MAGERAAKCKEPRPLIRGEALSSRWPRITRPASLASIGQLVPPATSAPLPLASDRMGHPTEVFASKDAISQMLLGYPSEPPSSATANPRSVIALAALRRRFLIISYAYYTSLPQHAHRPAGHITLCTLGHCTMVLLACYVSVLHSELENAT